MSQGTSRVGRRAVVLGACASALELSAFSVHAHTAAGSVSPPEPAPETKLTLEDGSTTTLPALLKGRVTALQLMFTSCQATCPIQGALFAQTAKLLGEGSQSARLLSISIDPGRDTPAVLRQWLKRFGAWPRWRAAQPNASDLDGLSGFLKSKVPGSDPHTAQVYYFDRRARLVLRSVDFPAASEIAKSLEQLAKVAS